MSFNGKKSPLSVHRSYKLFVCHIWSKSKIHIYTISMILGYIENVMFYILLCTRCIFGNSLDIFREKTAICYLPSPTLKYNYNRNSQLDVYLSELKKSLSN